MRRTFGIASGPGNVNSLIGIGTLAKRMMISLNSDEYAIPNPQEIIDLYDEQIKLHGLEYSEKEEGED